MPSCIPPPFSLAKLLPLAHRRCSLRRLSTDASRLFLKFSDLVKHFSKHTPFSPPLLAPEAGARPSCPHPFDYARLITAFGRAGQADEALRLLRQMRADFGLRPDVVCYTAVIDALAEACRSGDALMVFEEMIVSGVPPDTAAYSVLVKLYACCVWDFDSAYEVLLWMAKCGCPPGLVTYTTLIAGLCSADRVVEAHGVLDLMLEEKCLPNVYTYTPIVQAYCSKGMITTAKRLINAMEAIGCAPNTVTYNVLIDALCKIASFDEVDKLLEESCSKNWEPDTVTFTTYMDGLCKFGRVKHAFQILEEMLQRSLLPNALTLNILLDGLCRLSMVSEAKQLLERSAELEWSASVVNYNTVMNRLSGIGSWMAVLKLFGHMFKKGIGPNSWTYSIVVHSLSKGGMLQLAKFIFDSKGFIANVMSYTTMIHNLYLVGKTDDAHILYNKMVDENVARTQITYSVIITYLCREGKFMEAIGYFYRSLGNGYSPVLFACLTHRLVIGAKVRETLVLLEWVLRQGMTIDVCIFHQLIKAFCRNGYCRSTNIYTVCHILDGMLQK